MCQEKTTLFALVHKGRIHMPQYLILRVLMMHAEFHKGRDGGIRRKVEGHGGRGCMRLLCTSLYFNG